MLAQVLQVDLHPLRTLGELHEVAFLGFLVAVGHELELADDRKVVRRSNLLLEGDVLDSSWSEHRRLRSVRGLEIRKHDRHGRSGKERSRILQLDSCLLGVNKYRSRGYGGEGQKFP